MSNPSSFLTSQTSGVSPPSPVLFCQLPMSVVIYHLTAQSVQEIRSHTTNDNNQVSYKTWECDLYNKKHFLSLFLFPSQTISLQIVLKYTCTPTYFVFVLSATLREGTYLHGQEWGSRLRKRLRLKGISLQVRTHFHWW